MHDTHHPLAALYYEDQSAAAKKRTAAFWKERVPKYLGYFERIHDAKKAAFLTGRRLTYVDLSLFQIVEGLRYAFPKRMRRTSAKIPRLVALHDRIAARRTSRPISKATPYRVQRGRHLPPLQGAGWVTSILSRARKMVIVALSCCACSESRARENASVCRLRARAEPAEASRAAGQGVGFRDGETIAAAFATSPVNAGFGLRPSLAA